MHFVNQDQTLARRGIAEAWAVKKFPCLQKLNFQKRWTYLGGKFDADSGTLFVLGAQ